jgi:lipid IVA palmitoyltransferase
MPWSKIIQITTQATLALNPSLQEPALLTKLIRICNRLTMLVNLPKLNPWVVTQFFIFLCSLASFQSVFAAESSACSDTPTLLKKICNRLHQVWTEGDPELYVSGYAWHNRFTYSHEKINTYNERAFGGGFGKGFYDEDGDWHALSAIAFLDSHKNIQPAAGYAFLKTVRPAPHLRAGAGFSVLLTARPDIFHNIPFPGVLPWLSLSYRRATLMATYIPGAEGAGNVLFVMGKWTFDKLA